MPHDEPSQRPPAAKAPVIRWAGTTDTGRFRKNNEDAFLALAFDAREVRYLGKTGTISLDGNDTVFAVSDGMGGAKAGEFASRIAVDQITRLLPRGFRLGAMGVESDRAELLADLFHNIHAAVQEYGRCYEECEGMGATLTLCWFSPGWLAFSHLGDSRLYFLPRDGDLRQLSHDHTHVGWLRRSGRINEREERTHPARNSLQMALGAGHQIIDPQVGTVGLEPGDRFLLCSDGLNDGMWDRRIGEMLRQGEIEDGTPGGLAAAMVKESVAESGRDNTTALVIEAGES